MNKNSFFGEMLTDDASGKWSIRRYIGMISAKLLFLLIIFYIVTGTDPNDFLIYTLEGTLGGSILSTTVPKFSKTANGTQSQKAQE